MIEHSPDIIKLSEALHKAQGAITGAAKDSKNPAFKSSYASLESVIDAARPALQNNGLSFLQAPGCIVDGAVEITTMIMHVSGQWIRSTLHVPLGKKDAQGVGSAITYGCRYSLMAALGMPPVDDDGAAATERPVPVRAAPIAVPDEASQPVDAKAVELWRNELRACVVPADIDRLKKMPEFVEAWKAMNKPTRERVAGMFTTAVAAFASREAA